MEPSPGTSSVVSWMVVVEQWGGATGTHIDNTDKLFWLVIFKAAVDTMSMYLCVPGCHQSFLGLCSISILLINWVTAVLMVGACFYGDEGFAKSPCSILANASAIYAALPLPMLCFGILDYCLDDSCFGRRRPMCKLLRNLALLLLVWTQACSSSRSVSTELVIEGGAGERFLICSLETIPLINISASSLAFAVLFALLPFHSRIVQWMTEANRLTDERLDQNQSIRKSDFPLLIPSEECQSCEGDCRQGADELGPPLWVSLTLAFTCFWLPYLVMSLLIQLYAPRMPAFILVNLFWLECSRSVMEGVVFWARSRKSGPYSHLPENICRWQVYWHLSREAQLQQPSPGAFNQFTGKKNTILFV